jgi:hypothetical protein
VSTYLVVANQTAISRELSDALVEKTKQERSAEFILVVPATEIDKMVLPEAGQARQVAARRAGRALTHLTDLGVPIVGAHIGGSSLMTAIDDAIRERAIKYDGIIISTFPPGVSSWLNGDMLKKLETAFNLPVTHIISGGMLRAQAVG